MPHLQFEFNRPLSDGDRERLTDWTTIEYAELMATDTDHVAVSIREDSTYALSLGRATNGDRVAILNADIRAGRSNGQRERFAMAVIDQLDDWFDVPAEHCYVVYTEHEGHDFVLEEGALASWTPSESED